MRQDDKIVVRGAREHNLKNIDLEIPRNKLVVITGVSGSGKSSLAFDTIYAEGQRRYVESLSAYARQFLGQMEKPKVDYIGGLSPAISIEQKSTSKNPRSTVGTVTEIYDYMRVLWARVGVQHCHQCGKPVGAQSTEQILERLLSLPEGTKLLLLAPQVRDRKGNYRDLFEDMRREGFARARVDGVVYELERLLPPEGKKTAEIELDKRLKHSIEIVVDRIVIREGIESRLADSVETTLEKGEGLLIAQIIEGEEFLLSQRSACVDCGISFDELSPQNFSFNSPKGMCPSCDGLGRKLEFDPTRIVRDPSKSIREGAIGPIRSVFEKGQKSRWSRVIRGNLTELAEQYGFSIDTPFGDLTKKQQEVIIDGPSAKEKKLSRWKGVVHMLKRWFENTTSEGMRTWILEQYMTPVPCPACQGGRLRPESVAVKIGDRSIVDVTSLSIEQGIQFFDALEGNATYQTQSGNGKSKKNGKGNGQWGGPYIHPLEHLPEKLNSTDMQIGSEVLREIRGRLKFLLDVGLYYLTMDRAAPTLSGGEAQRIRLASQIGCGLVGVLYILDEPSIGLHQRDNQKLIDTLCSLRDLGNTVLVVEHDEETMEASDYLLDFGPGAGVRGGEIVVAGTPEQVKACHDSLTGQYLSGKSFIEVPSERRPGNGKKITIVGAEENNLKGIDVDIPLGKFICITGVSGSGKSSLINEILYKSLAASLNGASTNPGKHKLIRGLQHLDKVIDIDQKPIGRTPRSNPATYTKVFDPIRNLFSTLPEAKLRGYQPGRFSFNVKGGRCDACEGDGVKRIEMHFLADVFVTCDVCKGTRFKRETLQVKFKGHSIAEVLDLTVNEAVQLFKDIPKVRKILDTLVDVGLGYIHLGQAATTLSGGEAQRVKLARELCKSETGQTLYILDEPTTGLHFADVQKLLNVLNRLMDRGNTIVVIEHNLDVIKSADHVIDLGPEGGIDGGAIVAEGTPEEVAEHPTSYTGHFLQKVLKPKQKSKATARKSRKKATAV
jgi:excinuclease ABC subunit A